MCVAHLVVGVVAVKPIVFLVLHVLVCFPATVQRTAVLDVVVAHYPQRYVTTELITTATATRIVPTVIATARHARTTETPAPQTYALVAYARILRSAHLPNAATIKEIV